MSAAARWAALGGALLAVAVLAGCAGGTARPKPAELKPVVPGRGPAGPDRLLLIRTTFGAADAIGQNPTPHDPARSAGVEPTPPAPTVTAASPHRP